MDNVKTSRLGMLVAIVCSHASFNADPQLVNKLNMNVSPNQYSLIHEFHVPDISYNLGLLLFFPYFKCSTDNLSRQLHHFRYPKVLKVVSTKMHATP